MNIKDVYDIWNIKSGDRVTVSDVTLKSYNQIGTVISHNSNSAFVRFDNWRGQGIKELVFSKSKLVKIYNKDGVNAMEVKGNYRVAMVKFVEGTNTTKEYAFALFDTWINVGDIVLCDTAYGYQVAEVIRIVPKNEYSGCVVTKEIVCKLDFSNFNDRKEKRKKREELKKQMDKMVKDNQEIILYQALAEKSPEMAEMLAVYKSLGDV